MRPHRPDMDGRAALRDACRRCDAFPRFQRLSTAQRMQQKFAVVAPQVSDDSVYTRARSRVPED